MVLIQVFTVFTLHLIGSETGVTSCNVCLAGTYSSAQGACACSRIRSNHALARVTAAVSSPRLSSSLGQSHRRGVRKMGLIGYELRATYGLCWLHGGIGGSTFKQIRPASAAWDAHDMFSAAQALPTALFVPWAHILLQVDYVACNIWLASSSSNASVQTRRRNLASLTPFLRTGRRSEGELPWLSARDIL